MCRSRSTGIRSARSFASACVQFVIACACAAAHAAVSSGARARGVPQEKGREFSSGKSRPDRNNYSPVALHIENPPLDTQHQSGSKNISQVKQAVPELVEKIQEDKKKAAKIEAAAQPLMPKKNTKDGFVKLVFRNGHVYEGQVMLV